MDQSTTQSNHDMVPVHGVPGVLKRMAAWLAGRRRVRVERNPLTPQERALITNLSAMR
jgi:hypothetical protein